MKIIFPLVVFLAGLLNTACREDGLLADGIVEVGKGGCEAKTVGGKTLRVCYEKLVEDSRCPYGGVCVWAGRAVVQLTVSVDAEKHTLLLATQKMAGAPSPDTTVNGIAIRLKNVSPYPKKPNPGKDAVTLHLSSR